MLYIVATPIGNMRKIEIEEWMMPDDLVRYYFPEMDEDDVDWVLMNKTRWPFGSIEDIGDDVYDYYVERRCYGVN